MTADPFAAFPAMPPGIAEWEELLVRLELAPRAVRIALDSVQSELWMEGRDPQGWNVAAHLAHLAQREEEAADWLNALRDAGELRPWSWRSAEALVVEVGTGAVDRDLRHFTERRARNFAAVQRRGIEVWNWRAVHPEYGAVALFQLLAYLVEHDGRHLKRLRAALRRGA
jgi:hypothetical protein